MKYTAPEMEMVAIETEDVILTSPTVPGGNTPGKGELPEEEF